MSIGMGLFFVGVFYFLSVGANHMGIYLQERRWERREEERKLTKQGKIVVCEESVTDEG